MMVWSSKVAKMILKFTETLKVHLRSYNLHIETEQMYETLSSIITGKYLVLLPC